MFFLSSSPEIGEDWTRGNAQVFGSRADRGDDIICEDAPRPTADRGGFVGEAEVARIGDEESGEDTAGR